MNYHLYALQFDSPIHFGSVEQGAGIEHTDFSFSSDAFFSALVAELLKAKQDEMIAHLLDKVEKGALRFSSLLPWKRLDGKIAFYLPRPLFVLEPAKNVQETFDYQSTCRAATQLKKQKKIKFIRASRLQMYFSALIGKKPFAEDNDFGIETLRQCANCRELETLPYFVGQFGFKKQAGLYIILGAKDDLDAQIFAKTLDFIGLSGLGGKKSSGLGKFHVEWKQKLSDKSSENDDAKMLYKMLQAENAPWQMTLAGLIPDKSNLPMVKEGYYSLRRAGGFVTTASLGKKKNSVCLLNDGSCFKSRLEGTLACLGESDAHPIWRYGYGLYIGIMGD